MTSGNARTSLIDANSFIMHPNSGTNYHMSGNHLPVPIPFKFGNGQCLSAAREGLIRLTDNVTLSHVLYVPGLNVNLISTTATPWKYKWTINPNTMTLRNRAHPDTVYCTAKRKDSLYDAVFPRPAKVHVTKSVRPIGNHGVA